MATSAADVPGLYDLVIAVPSGNTTGFLLNDSLESSIPFRTHRAIYSYTPTFIERQNVSGDFGDNQQDFFPTATQRDWSLGEQQRYFHQSDADSVRRYWQGDSVDVLTRPGSVRMRDKTSSAIFGSSVRAVCEFGYPAGGGTTVGDLLAAGTTNLFATTFDGTTRDLGAHGLGAAPDSWGIAADGLYAYLTTLTAGTVGVRRRNLGAGTWSTFSASGASSLAFLNNTLYGYRNNSSADLVRWDTTGALTSLYTWKTANGDTNASQTHLRAFGGKLAILRSSFAVSGSELWIYDGTAPSKVAEFPANFFAYQMEVVVGTLFVGGVAMVGTSNQVRPTIWSYSGGAVSKLWQADSTISTGGALLEVTPGQVAMAPFEDGFIFNDDTRGVLCFYSSTSGGVSTIGSYTVAGDTPRLASSINILLHTRNQTTGYFYPGTTKPTSASVSTSLFDFDSSLTKVFRSITAEFDSATDGNGGTVDVAYRVGDVDSSYTTLASGVTSGAENLFGSTVTGKRISAKVTLNKGTSTAGPVLKRISMRAAPILTRYRQQEYILNCAGDPSTEDAMALRDDANSTHPLSGRQQVNELRLAAASQTPLTLTDRFGNYTGIIEVLEAYEQHPSNADPSRSGSFLVKLGTREV